MLIEKKLRYSEDPFITLCLGSIGMNIGMDFVKSCYKRLILHRNYRKMTNYGHFLIIPL